MIQPCQTVNISEFLTIIKIAEALDIEVADLFIYDSRA
jgi:hypothetical protein